MKVLAIIDMQEPFLSRRKDVRRCVRPVRNLVRRFHLYKWPMIRIEMIGFGETVPWIETNGCSVVAKLGVDGSEGILDICKEKKWPLDFVLCGIYREICVCATARGLSKEVDCRGRGSVTVISNATRPQNPKDKPAWSNAVQVISSREFYRGLKTSQKN